MKSRILPLLLVVFFTQSGLAMGQTVTGKQAILPNGFTATFDDGIERVVIISDMPKTLYAKDPHKVEAVLDETIKMRKLHLELVPPAQMDGSLRASVFQLIDGQLVNIISLIDDHVESHNSWVETKLIACGEQFPTIVFFAICMAIGALIIKKTGLLNLLSASVIDKLLESAPEGAFKTFSKDLGKTLGIAVTAGLSDGIVKVAKDLGPKGINTAFGEIAGTRAQHPPSTKNELVNPARLNATYKNSIERLNDLLARDKFDDILKECMKLKKEFPSEAPPLMFKAIYYHRPQGENEKALRLLETAHSIEENNPEILYHMATHYEQKGDFPTAIVLLSGAINLPGVKPKYLLKRAFARWAQWDKTKDNDKTLIQKALEDCDRAHSIEDWAHKENELFVCMHNSALYFLTLLGDEMNMQRAAEIACYLERHINNSTAWPEIAQFLDTLAFFYFSIYENCYLYTPSSGTKCEDSRIEKTDKPVIEHLKKAEELYAKALQQDMDIEWTDSTRTQAIGGSDMDTFAQYTKVVLMLRRAEKPDA